MSSLRTKQSGKIATTEPSRREPNWREVDAIDRATKAIGQSRERPHVQFEPGNPNSVQACHDDQNGAAIHRMVDAFGTCSEYADAFFVGQLEFVTRHRGEKRGDSDTNLNAGLAIVASVEPKSEIEACLAIQMAGTHALATEMLGRARHTTDMDNLERCGNLAVKLERTFVAQIEALAKLRSGGKQTVEVKHVHVDARGSQNIIAETVTTGGGAAGQNRDQPHASALAFGAGVPVAPVWSQDEVGVPVSGAGSQEPEEVPHAWR